MAGPNLPSLAWRNLWRNPRRTVLTLISIAMGMFLALMFTALQDQSFTDLINNNARNVGGHVLIQHPEFHDTPTLTRTLRGTPQILDRVRADPAVSVVVERIVSSVLVQSARESAGGMLMAIDPEQETPETFRLDEALVQGETFGTSEEEGVLLGDELANVLGVSLGDKVRYTLMDREGELVAGMERVRGLLHTGSPGLDAGLMILPLKRARAVLAYEADESVQVGMFLRDGRRANEIAARYRGDLPPTASALSWSDVAPDLAGFIALKVGGALFLEAVIGLLVAASIFNTLFMSVTERTREFGIQIAIGCRPRQLFAMVLWESLFLALVGVVCGLLVFVGPYWYMSAVGFDMSGLVGGEAALDVAGVGMETVIRVGITTEHLIGIVAAVVVATLIAGLYPAWRAGQVQPVAVINLG